MDFTITLGGLFCYCLACIAVPDNSTLLITSNMSMVEELCTKPTEGCALLDQNIAIVYKGQPKRTNWVIFHELLHLELGREHTFDFVDREKEAVVCIYSGELFGATVGKNTKIQKVFK